MTITNGNTLDAEIIQEIMNQPGSAKDKLDQLKGYVDGTHPISYSPDEIINCSLFTTGADLSDQTVWSSKTPDRYYTFLPAKYGERILHGLFEETKNGRVIYKARFNRGNPVESYEYYNSGNIKTHNSFNANGQLVETLTFFDEPDAFPRQRICSTMNTGINSSGTGMKMTFTKNEDQTCSILTDIPTFEGLNHGTAYFYYPSGELRATEEYYFGKENGNWYGYYEDGVPKYFQQWQDGVLIFERNWYHSGHLRQSFIEGNEYNYNIPTEMSFTQDWPEIENTPDMTVDKANNVMASLKANEGMLKMWDDILHQAVRYGLRTISLDCARSAEERDFKMEAAQNHFGSRGFRIYELPIANTDLMFLSYICLHIPN